MSIARLLAAAIGIQLIGLGGLFVVAGLIAAMPFFDIATWNRLDLANHLLPLWLFIVGAGALITLFSLERRRAKTAILGFAVFSLVGGGAPVLGEMLAGAVQALRRPPPRNDDLKVLQFNTFVENPYPPLAQSVILEADSDILTLHEPHPELRASPELLAQYPYRTPCPDEVCIIAIWSKRPITAYGHDGSLVPDAPQSVELERLWAETTGPDGRPVRVVTTHYHWPLPPKFQWPQRAALLGYIEPFDRNDLILTGDFNSTPWSVALRRQDRSLTPLQRRTRALATWPAYVPRLWSPPHIPLLPIDHVYAGPAWETVQVERLRRAASDHYPVLVTLRRAAASGTASE